MMISADLYQRDMGMLDSHATQQETSN